ncbi:MAG: hypothetical protein UU40_C0007G0042 [Candidatus Uhrbacteria bacterium GW2011_GWD2_41_121]|uniref:Uncharacterized protein n=1 Tax=Candidatus Uhrbacteria bacterium GW2011_GWC1_41_20 TaxID=1618983 RepID=A0A0G0VEB9_9BACT|nr:MAG: hypothetical protein UT52_C0010G0042 [Candidatus Uhrbacteria bacterium GW2011_GWE1_39_46]KKR63901.1 MAG: hypothetical protein UU04_C0009G0010 [Candidatus Uhrbacteria bacterium GW2011_GWC2_40_450]KKR90187.1 MAG: hypothetical protein UU40_C0007G0042 [Candidatus Uhrbacteria bacterium GW2011_GWD2_41_121]KKR96110.1 MAG: hypothetical protein UU46_C0007G0009 [Candidatus Uhrbacteria bacterium GW2011_GWD1_41_16]KKR99193.1 MAG: hypothetical protein UU50_C0009G0010 [Candidatus Uhrbacteria bacteriu
MSLTATFTPFHMHEYLNDPIDVTVDFIDSRVRPRSVCWDNRVYAMKNVNLVHSTNEEGQHIFYFSVSDDTNFMKLRLNTKNLEWRLVELYTD